MERGEEGFGPVVRRSQVLFLVRVPWATLLPSSLGLGLLVSTPESFDWVTFKATCDHCLPLERQSGKLIKISASEGRLTWL